MNPVVLLLFFLSGATALVYEVLWSKYLTLMFGSTVQAQTVVLAVFMGGLALGNQIFGKRAVKLGQPLAAYGYVELAIGLYAFFFPTIYSLADKIFIAMGSHLNESPLPLLALKGALAVGLLALPTILMGGTLPLLASWLERQMSDAGRGSARFYSTNSLGAVFGSGVAGFYLVQQWGMMASLQWTAFANLLVAMSAIAISRQRGDLAHAPQSAGADTPFFKANTMVILVAVTGGVSMGLEVLSSRAVAMIVGGSLQSFAIVLMAFILGIGTGAGIVASPRFVRWQNQRTIFGLMLGAATVIGLLIFRVEDFVILYTHGRYGLAANATGYFLHQFVVGLVAIVVLGIPAGLLGAVLPMAIRSGSPNGGSLSDQVGRLLTWNTIGAVIGVLLTGFILMPLAGLRGSFLILGTALALIGGVGAARFTGGARGLSYAGFALAVCLAGLITVGSEKWNSVVGAGLYRIRNVRLTSEDMVKRRAAVTLHYYKDAPDATVSVEENTNDDGVMQYFLRINGKTDASSRGDLATQYLLGHLPVFSRPESKDIFVLGLGSGITAAAALTHPIESITVAENCAPVLEAAALFGKWNRSVLSEPRLHIRREDARTVLKLSERKYDIIINEPSNPWVVGVGSVFSREFYELCASRLKDGGINAQWFHIYEMHDGIVELVIRTFESVYPYVEIWEPLNGDLILLGSKQPWPSTPEVFAKSFEREKPRLDMQEVGFKTPASIFARQLASQATSFAIVGEGPTQSDEFPVLEYSAPEAFFIGEQSRRLFSFDERTRQSVFAPAWKRKLMQDLPEADLRTVYREFSTANPDLLKYFNWIKSAPAGARSDRDLDPAMPIAFRSPQSYLLSPDASASEVEVKLYGAENDILTESPKASDAIAAIETVIAAEPLKVKGKRAWQPAHYAVVAARAALARNDFARASHLIEMGLKFDPANVELPYLQRLLDARRQRQTAAR